MRSRAQIAKTTSPKRTHRVAPMVESANPIDPRRQLRQRLDSLQSAGIEFLPRAAMTIAAPLVVPAAIETNVENQSVAPAAPPTTPSNDADQRRIELRQ